MAYSKKFAKEACYAAQINETQNILKEITIENVDQAILKKLEDYSSRHIRCLETFIEQKGKSSDDVPLYIPYYFIKILLNESFDNIIPGLKRRNIQEKIKEIHHRAESVRASDMGYFLTTLVSNQIKKGISPPLFDFDNGTSTVKVIDSTFYFFLKNSNKVEVLENLTLPTGIEE